MPIDNITEERAARRFHQIARLERQIRVKYDEIDEAKTHAKELGDELAALLRQLRAAARDEGDLPLFDL